MTEPLHLQQTQRWRRGSVEWVDPVQSKRIIPKPGASSPTSGVECRTSSRTPRHQEHESLPDLQNVVQQLYAFLNGEPRKLLGSLLCVARKVPSSEIEPHFRSADQVRPGEVANIPGRNATLRSVSLALGDTPKGAGGIPDLYVNSLVVCSTSARLGLKGLRSFFRTNSDRGKGSLPGFVAAIGVVRLAAPTPSIGDHGRSKPLRVPPVRAAKSPAPSASQIVGRGGDRGAGMSATNIGSDGLIQIIPRVQLDPFQQSVRIHEAPMNSPPHASHRAGCPPDSGFTLPSLLKHLGQVTFIGFLLGKLDQREF